MSFRAGGKRRCFFMADVNPLNLLRCANGIGDAVERIAGHTVNLPDTRFRKNFHKQIRYFLPCH